MVIITIGELIIFSPPATWIGGLVIGLASTMTFFIIERAFYKKEPHLKL